MAAPSGTVWGRIVDGSSSGRKGRLGIYTSVSSTNTETTVNVQVWFWTIYSCSDGAANTIYYNAGTNVTSATSVVKTNKDISHTVATGEGWNTANQTCIYETTHVHDRGTSAVTYNIYAKFSGIDMLNGAVNANTTYPVPALTSYTVSYNANGGSGAPSSQTKWYGKSLTLSSSKPTRTGYAFQGWATSSSGSVAYAAGASYTANAGVTLYAVWKANTYTVKYDANGGTGAPGSQTKTYGTTLKLSTTKPTRTNYNFLGWATSKSATTAKYAAGANYTANAAATLYAVWELAYTKPRINNLSVSRCDSSNNVKDDGTSALISFDYECDQAISSIAVAYESAAHGSGSTTISATAQSGSISQRIFTGSLSVEATYTITVTVTDASGYSVAFATVGGTAYTVDFLAGGNGVAFGKPAEIEDVLDIQFKTRMLGGMMPVVLEAETDLNTVLIPGTYTGDNISNYNYVNCPVTSGTFTLLVESCGEDGQVRQTYSSCSKYKPERFSRFYYQGEWGSWFWANTDEVLLYENTSGSAGDITLTLNNDGETSCSAANFRYLEIYFTDNNGKSGGYTKVWNPNGKTVCLQITEANSTIYSRQTLYHITTQYLAPETQGASYYRINSDGVVSVSLGTNYIKVVRVVGRA